MWGPTNPLYTLTATVNCICPFVWFSQPAHSPMAATAAPTLPFYFIRTKWKSQFRYEWPHPFPPNHGQPHLSLPLHEKHHPSLHNCDWSHAPFPTTLAPMLSLPWTQSTPHCNWSDLGSEFRERMLLACWLHCLCPVFIQPSPPTIFSSVNPYLSMNYMSLSVSKFFLMSYNPFVQHFYWLQNVLFECHLYCYKPKIIFSYLVT